MLLKKIWISALNFMYLVSVYPMDRSIVMNFTNNPTSKSTF